MAAVYSVLDFFFPKKEMCTKVFRRRERSRGLFLTDIKIQEVSPESLAACHLCEYA